MTQKSYQSSCVLRLLVVDDEIELRTLLAMRFEKLGFCVDSAEDGAQAAELIKKINYDFILCDLNLPGEICGQDLFEIVKKENLNSKFIAITGYAQDSSKVQEARSRGIAHVFSKPLQMSALLNLISPSV